MIISLFYGALTLIYFCLVMPNLIDGDYLPRNVVFCVLSMLGLCAYLLRRHFIFPKAAWVAGLLALWETLSLTWSVDPLGFGAVAVCTAWAGFALLAVCANIAPRHRPYIIGGVVLSLVVNALLALMQFYDFPQGLAGVIPLIIPQVAPPAATFSNKNLMSSFMAMALPLCAWVALCATARWRRLFGYAAWFLTAWAIIDARSRGSWLAILLGGAATLGFYLFYRAKNPNTTQAPAGHKKQAAALAALFLLAVVLGNAGSPNDAMQGKGHMSATQQAETFVTDTGQLTGVRLAYMFNTASLWLEHPLAGLGAGSFRAGYASVAQHIIATPHNGYNIEARPARAHSDPIQLLAELGQVGFLLVAALYLLTLKSLLQAPLSPLKVTLFACLAIVTFNSLWDFPLQMPVAYVLAMALVGITAGIEARPHATTPLHKAAALACLCCAGFFGWAGVIRLMADHQLVLATIYYQVGLRGQMPVDAINKAYATDPNHPDVRDWRAVIYGRCTDAKIPAATRLQVIGQTLKTDPYAANHLVNYSSLLLHEVAADHSKLPLLIDAVNRLKTSQPNAPETLVFEGYIDAAQQNPTTAAQKFNAALAAQPDYMPAKAGLSILAEKK